MRGATLGSLILFVVMLATACSSGGTDQPTDPTVTPTPRRLSPAAVLELDPAPGLPGKYVNLPEIYKDERGPASYDTRDRDVPSTAPHVKIDIDYEADGNSNPPAGGPHWAGPCGAEPENAPRFCGPAPWGIYRESWSPATLVHNMEHGGTIIWYNTTDQGVIGDLEDFVSGNRDKLLVLAPYPGMEAEHIAITVWTRIDLIPVSEYSRDPLEEFMDAWYCKWDPEGFC